MKLEPISKKIKPILDSIRDRIADDKGTEHVVENPSGWAYGGAEFLKDVESLRREIQAELKENSFQVLACTVRHFFTGANILNRFYPTKRMLIIPINGDSTLSPGGPLPVDTYCYIENRPALSGDNIDVIFVAYEIQHRDA